MNMFIFHHWTNITGKQLCVVFCSSPLNTSTIHPFTHLFIDSYIYSIIFTGHLLNTNYSFLGAENKETNMTWSV